MRFWDSSALFPLFVEQDASQSLRTWTEDEEDLAIWVLSDVEVVSGLARMVREERMEISDAQAVLPRLKQLFERNLVIDALPAVASRARRLLLVHPLRAADALQLAAAIVAARDDPTGFEFVSVDERLCAAARREGFVVRP